MNVNNNLLLVFVFLLGVAINLGAVAVTDQPRTFQVKDATKGSMDGCGMGTGGCGCGGMMMHQVSSEEYFIVDMIPHHQEAIDTAREVLERGGTTEEVRALMNDIIAAQTVEIEKMKVWYEAWYGEVYEDTGAYEPMMRELANLRGAELDRVFLEDMIMHHMGAIMMARSVQPYVEHEEIAELTQAIVSTQSAEITQMRQMLQVL